MFAITRVVAFIARSLTAATLDRGLIPLLPLWWSWAAYVWLGNRARTDQGLVRAGMLGCNTCPCGVLRWPSRVEHRRSADLLRWRTSVITRRRAARWGSTARDRNRVAAVLGPLIHVRDGGRRLRCVSGRAVGTHREGPRGGVCCSSVA
ncbi:low temperature requirement protein A [Streptomyces sp. NPDC059837]|uniref:low temperature requirement protein A n=1 Tax=unclassified Streptomyces TaxID=2593676 RepID=UPI00338E4AAB